MLEGTSATLAPGPDDDVAAHFFSRSFFNKCYWSGGGRHTLNTLQTIFGLAKKNSPLLQRIVSKHMLQKMLRNFRTKIFVLQTN